MRKSKNRQPGFWWEPFSSPEGAIRIDDNKYFARSNLFHFDLKVHDLWTAAKILPYNIKRAYSEQAKIVYNQSLQFLELSNLDQTTNKQRVECKESLLGNNWLYFNNVRRRGDVMVSVLVSGFSGPGWHPAV